MSTTETETLIDAGLDDVGGELAIEELHAPGAATEHLVAGRPLVVRGLIRTGSSALSALLSIVVILGFWQLCISWFKLDPFITRGPADVWRYLTDPANAADRELLREATLVTLRDAGIGLVGGSAAAVVVAVVFTLRRTVEQVFMPLAMVLRTVPLVAMTPLIALIFGRGLLAVTIIAGIVTFFPTLVNMTLALRSVPSQSIDLMRAYGASPFTTLRKVQFPSSLPALFASLRVAAPLALIGALLAEWLATGKGLGYLMLAAVSLFQSDRLWTGVAIVTIASLIAYNVISAVERAVLARYAPGSGRPSML